MDPQFDFKRKFCLLDTNILKEMTQKTKHSELFTDVFNFLKKEECPLFITDGTKFEFLGYSGNKKDFEFLENWTAQLTCLPLMKDDVYCAARLSSMYKCKNPSINPKQISFVDCLHASQLIKYKDKCFILTTDTNDYPSFLFDMHKYVPIEEESGSTIFVGFKTYNEKKWIKLQTNYNSSG